METSQSYFGSTKFGCFEDTDSIFKNFLRNFLGAENEN